MVISNTGGSSVCAFASARGRFCSDRHDEQAFRPSPMRGTQSAEHEKGYAAPAYAQALDSIGTVVPLGASGGWCLLRPVAGTHWQNATGSYPFLSFMDWNALPVLSIKRDSQIGERGGGRFVAKASRRAWRARAGDVVSRRWTWPRLARSTAAS